MLIEQLIGDLLLRHNCVVVPAFGGFVAKQMSAVIDYKTGIMHPPKKSLLFNKQLINNDGLLASAFAKESGKSFDEASSEIQAQVISWRKALNAGERIQLENIGFLFLDQEKNIGFEQDRYFNLLLQSYGLSKVHFISEEDIQLVAQPTTRINPIEKEEEEAILEMHPTEIRTIERTLDVVGEDKSIAPKSNSKIWRYIAAASMIPFVFYSYWIPMETKVLESKIISWNDFNPFYKTQENTYTPSKSKLKIDSSDLKKINIQEELNQLPSDVKTWSYPFDENLFMPLQMAKKEVILSNEGGNTSDAKTENQQSEELREYVIANCFASEENATNFVKILNSKGFEAQIIDFNGGLYRVSAGKIDNLSDFNTLQTKLEEMDISGSWILKIKK